MRFDPPPFSQHLRTTSIEPAIDNKALAPRPILPLGTLPGVWSHASRSPDCLPLTGGAKTDHLSRDFNMYNAHRGMAQPASRLEEYITGIRQEFENATNGASESDQRSEFSFTTPLLLFHFQSSPQDSAAAVIVPTIARAKYNLRCGVKMTDLTPPKVQSQMQEMEMVRQKVYDLERNQTLIKQRFGRSCPKIPRPTNSLGKIRRRYRSPAPRDRSSRRTSLAPWRQWTTRPWECTHRTSTTSDRSWT